LNKLIEFLLSLQKGDVSKSNVSKLEHLLCECWGEFSGSGSEGMEANKLIGHMQDVYLKYPFLYFVVELNGGTVLASKKTEMLNWLLNIENKQATCQKKGYRLSEPRSNPVFIVSIAKEVIRKILNHQKDPRIKWENNGTVRLLMEEMISTGRRTTLNYRRKKIRGKVDEILLPIGWQKIGVDLYALPSPNFKPKRPEEK
jgi:hypothetical protein